MLFAAQTVELHCCATDQCTLQLMTGSLHALLCKLTRDAVSHHFASAQCTCTFGEMLVLLGPLR